MSKPFNTISITLFVIFNIAALSIVTNGWSEPWVTSASAYTVEHEPNLTSAAPTDNMDPAGMVASANRDTTAAYPYPIPVRMTRSGSEVSLLAQIIDLLLNMSLNANDAGEEIEVNLYQLNNLNAYDQARIIGSAFKTEILDQNGQPVTKLDEPITLVFRYADSGMLDGDEEALQLYQWDESTQKWLPIESSIDIENNTITANIHVGGDNIVAASGQSIRRSGNGSFELALMGRSHLYLPAIQGVSEQAVEAPTVR